MHKDEVNRKERIRHLDIFYIDCYQISGQWIDCAEKESPKSTGNVFVIELLQLSDKAKLILERAWMDERGKRRLICPDLIEVSSYER